MLDVGRVLVAADDRPRHEHPARVVRLEQGIGKHPPPATLGQPAERLTGGTDLRNIEAEVLIQCLRDIPGKFGIVVHEQNARPRISMSANQIPGHLCLITPRNQATPRERPVRSSNGNNARRWS